MSLRSPAAVRERLTELHFVAYVGELDERHSDEFYLDLHDSAFEFDTHLPAIENCGATVTEVTTVNAPRVRVYVEV